MKAITLASGLALTLVLFTCGALASIEREPVRVDRNNAGPEYDIDELERTRVLAENQENNQVATAPRLPMVVNTNSGDDRLHKDDQPMISIRRIFLVPVMSSPPASSPSDEAADQAPSDPMRMFGMPPRSLFAPFSTRHLFGGDEASRPRPVNQPDESQERPVVSSGARPEQEGSRPISAMFDPVEMLVEAMRQALNPANMLPTPPQAGPESTDLNKEASGESNKPASEGSETGLVVDKKPQSFNSTKEDIVEIDGKKYLRKTVINRHVGDGIMFMTRRLIFSPLNETETESSTTESNKVDLSSSTTTTTTVAPSTEQPSNVDKIDEPAESSTSTSTISSTASDSPTTREPVATETPASPQDQPSTTVATDKEDTTKSLGDKITDTMSKVERLMEKMIESKEESASSTVKPSSS